MRWTRRVSPLVAVLLLAAACSGAGDAESDQVSAESVEGGAASEPATRLGTQVVVVGADAEAVDAIRAAVFDYDLGGVLEQLVILGSPSCEVQSGDLIECQSDLQLLDDTSGRRFVVVLDDAFGIGAEVVDTIGGSPNILISGQPGDAANELTGLGSPLTFVPHGLSGAVPDSVATLLVGVNDELAAFTPTTLVGGTSASLTSTFFDDRLAGFAREANPDLDAAADVVPEPDVRWVLDLPEPKSSQGIHERAIVVDGVVAFLGNDGVARGVDALDGAVLWSREFETEPGGQAESFVAASGNTLLLGSGGQGRDLNPDPDAPDRSLWALDIRTGDTIWEVNVGPGGASGHPATDGQSVFAWIAEDDDDISLRAFDVIDGAEIWRTEGSMGFGPPRVDSGEVWTGSEDGALRGFDSKTGEELARFDRIGLGVAGVASRPATTDERVFFGNDNATFYAIDRTTGDLDWSFATDSPNLPSSPVIADDIVVFGSFDGGVYGLDIDDGELRWRYDRGEDIFLSSAAVADDTVYIASFTPPSSLLALDAQNGEALWELSIGEQTSASPFVDGDTVYIQSPGKLWAVAR